MILQQSLEKGKERRSLIYSIFSLEKLKATLILSETLTLEPQYLSRSLRARLYVSNGKIGKGDCTLKEWKLQREKLMKTTKKW